MTSDTVDSRIGTLKFVDGVPTVVTTQKLYDKGGQFAAWELPKLFSEEVRAGFRSLQ